MTAQQIMAPLNGILCLNDPAAIARVEKAWSSLSHDFERIYATFVNPPMIRTELSFHEYVKLLGYICIDTEMIEGDILEIGVWKGKSLALMDRLSTPETRVIGIDPCELAGQKEELSVFIEKLLPHANVIVGYSEAAIEHTLTLSKSFKLIHIDGGHKKRHVWTDFLLYSHFLVPGGYIVFDDYGDDEHSPEVRPAVDQLQLMGLFDQYFVIGQISSFEKSFVIRKRF